MLITVNCVLQLAHGADPSMKNQEGQTPLDLTTVRILRVKINLNRNCSINSVNIT